VRESKPQKELLPRQKRKSPSSSFRWPAEGDRTASLLAAAQHARLELLHSGLELVSGSLYLDLKGS